METYWGINAKGIIDEIYKELGEENLKILKEKKPFLHFFYSIRQFVFLFLSLYILFKTNNLFLIIFFSAFSGLTIFNFLTLLHEVLHNLVFKKQRIFLSKFLAYLYSFWTTISPTQFTKWHLDHHSQLGSTTEDPKRHHLAPKKRSRILKLLYFTPALFYIYFKASKEENKRYPKKVLKKIKKERIFFLIIHIIIQPLIFYSGGFILWIKIYFLPLFIFFPISFGLNRMGQHYARSSESPLGWTTFIKGSIFWDFIFLKSNYHLEHHLLPTVPFYNLPKLQRNLLNFYEKNKLMSYNFLELFYLFIFLNKEPYKVWK